MCIRARRCTSVAVAGLCDAATQLPQLAASPTCQTPVTDPTGGLPLAQPLFLFDQQPDAAWEAGADFVKVFPCSNVGGAKYIKAVKAPLPQVEMIPTGGVNLDTIGDFLKAGASAVAVGSELIDNETIKAGRYDVFTERAKQFLAAVKAARS